MGSQSLINLIREITIEQGATSRLDVATEAISLIAYLLQLNLNNELPDVYHHFFHHGGLYTPCARRRCLKNWRRRESGPRTPP